MDPTTQASSLLDRILEKATDNLRIAKIFQQMGLDPDNITYQAILDRLLDIAIANITIANMCALIGAGFFVATLLTRTMVPLRVSNMISCFFFILFGALGKDIRVFLLYLLLLPINGIRLYQMLRLVKKARNAAQGDTSMEWLKPFMTQRKYRKGDVLFKKGDAANEMYLTVTGKFVVSEIGVELPPGRLMGELGFLTPSNKRTATVECTEDGAVLTITYDKLLELYFQNPQFGYYFLVLTSQRLLENIGRLEEHIAQLKFESKSGAGAPPETPGRQVPVQDSPKQPQKAAAQTAAPPIDVVPAEPARRRVEMWKAVAAIHREVGQAYLLRRT